MSLKHDRLNNLPKLTKPGSLSKVSNPSSLRPVHVLDL